MSIHHIVLGGVSAEIRKPTGQSVEWTVDAVVERLTDRMEDKPQPAKRVIIDGRTSRGIGIDHGRAVEDIIDAGGGRIFFVFH